MKVLYITGNYDNIQPKILEALNRVKSVTAYLFYYELRFTNREIRMPENAEYYSLKNHIHGPFPYIYRLKKIKQAILDHYKSQGIDVVHANMGFRDGIIAYMLLKEIGIPYVISIRSTDINVKFLWKIPTIKKYCLNVLKHAQYVICLSESFETKLLDRLPVSIRSEVKNKTVIIPNGIDSFYLDNLYTRVKKNISEIRKLLFVGKIDHNKNIEAVVQAVEILKRKGYEFQLEVVGEIIDDAYNKLLTEKDFITYHAKCHKEELIKYYRSSDIFVVPSHTETFGLVYAEAMSQGLPVVYTRGQGFDSGGRDGVIGYAVSDTSPSEIAEKIISICENYNELSLNSVKMAREFDWSSIALDIIELYRNSI